MEHANSAKNISRVSGTKRAFCVIWCALWLAFAFAHAGDIKEANVAGAFYPASRQELSKAIDGYLMRADPAPVDGAIFALISPHAGYDFSGSTAAFGYKLITHRLYKTVIILGPSHHFSFDGVSVYSSGSFRTPLGDLEVDSGFTQKLLQKDKDIFFEPAFFEKEHSVEVQLPFLQSVLSGFKIVPIVMGRCSFETCERLAGLLKSAIGDRRDILVVASTDLYHGYDYREADIRDDLTITYFKQMDPALLYRKISEGSAELCGGMPVVVSMILSGQLGHRKCLVLAHTNSAAVTGKKIKGLWTVGYSSCVIDKEKEGEDAMLTKEQRQKLLTIARGAIEHYLKTGKKMEVSETDPALIQERGAFVTLREHNELRGCIGSLTGEQPLYLTIRDMAVEAATGDPRFPPVNLPELKDIEIEISVLSPLKKVDSPDEIHLGTHGVLVRKGFKSGVFLPQVASETGWSKEEFLSNLCAHKAGLAPLAWKDKNTDMYIFTAEAFSEQPHQ